MEHALTKKFPGSERCHKKSLLRSATVSRCDLERRLQERLLTGSPGNVESSELVLPLTWFVCTDRTWFNSLWPASVLRSKNSRRIMIATTSRQLNSLFRSGSSTFWQPELWTPVYFSKFTSGGQLDLFFVRYLRLCEVVSRRRFYHRTTFIHIP